MTSVFVAASAPALKAGLQALLDDSIVRVVDDSASADVVVVAGEGWQDELASMAPGALVLLTDDAVEGAAFAGLAGWAVLASNAGADQLLAAVQAAAQGLVVVPPRMLAGGSRRLAAPDLQEPLTAREQEVLQLLSQGLSNKLIARQLTISEHTVKFHVSATYAKLGASNRTEAVSHAARRGLISL